MAIKAKELRQKAKQKQARMKEILETSAEKLTADQEKEFDALDKDAEELIRQAEKIERIEKLEIEQESGEPIESPRVKKIEDLKPEERAKAEELAMRSFLMTGSVPQELRSIMPAAVKEKDDDGFIQKAMKDFGLTRAAEQTVTTSGGGYTIPRGFMAELEKGLKEFGGMWEAARIVRTTKGNVMDWPTVNDTNNKAYQLGINTSAATAAQAVVFGQQQFEAYKYTSGLIQIPTELLQDSEFNIGEEIKSLLVERIWRGTNLDLTRADGSGKVKGVLNGAVYGGSTGDDAALAYDDIVKLIHSVDPAYRKSTGTRFMFHDTVLAACKKIKDQQNLPVWDPGLMRVGEPSTLFSYKYTINQDMDIFWGGSTTDNDGDKTMLFGDFHKYIIRQVRDMRIIRLDERYADLDQTAFVVFFRIDGDTLNAGTNPIKFLEVAGT